MELWNNRNTNAYETKVYMLPKKLDEEVARLHLSQLGVKLTVLTQEQADYLGVPIEGPPTESTRLCKFHFPRNQRWL